MATAPKKQAEVITEEKPKVTQWMQVAASEPIALISMRMLASSLYVSAQNFARQECENCKPLATMQDTAAQYNYLLKVLDDFYAKARNGIGEVKIHLVAEASGFTST